ncbi:MAG: hypothetical protein O2780_07240 [Proteobacteria bacterium]|nr:hypothetical protein [Pseudomonadota bacterium]
MRHRRNVLTAILLTWWPVSALAEMDQTPTRPGCEEWSEDVVIGPSARGWKREEVTAYRNAPIRLPEEIAAQKSLALNAEVIHSKRRKVKVVKSPSKPGTHTMYNTETRFEVTYRQLPCEPPAPGKSRL